MIYKEKFKIGLKDVWKNSEVSNKAILEYLENIAAYHSDSVGVRCKYHRRNAECRRN